MKRLLSLLLLSLFSAVGVAQTVTVTFTGRDTNNQYVKLDKVVIDNITKNWEETITYPDTILTMGGVGIEDYDNASGFALFQNNPNPFDCMTYASLRTSENGKVTVGLIDMNGNIIAETQNFAPLQSGTHQFRIQVANAGTYLLIARQNGKTSSVKMVNNGRGAANKIEYMGDVEKLCTPSLSSKSTKGTSNKPFDKGDEMTYTAVAMVNGTEYQSQTISQQQQESEDIVLLFSIKGIPDDTTSTASVPTVKTKSSVTLVTQTTVVCGGEVIDDGGATIIERGICYGSSSNPTVDDAKSNAEGTVGAFTCELSNLSLGTTYFIRAYATNSVGTAYGNEVFFVTDKYKDAQPCPETPTITDKDGNTYNTVQIGDQCWMRENLRTVTYADGTPILQGTSTTSETIPYWNYPDDDSTNKKIYGLLYNWSAVMNGASSSKTNPSGVKGICPDGWHVPSDAEWKQLTTYVSEKNEYWCGRNKDNIAKALSSDIGWLNSEKSCAVGVDLSNNNSTGFSAVPAGYRTKVFVEFTETASMWSATQSSKTFAWLRAINYNSSEISIAMDLKTSSYPVRCLRDNAEDTTVKVALPVVLQRKLSM